MMFKHFLLVASFLSIVGGAHTARAEPRRGSFRFGIDTELFSITALSTAYSDTEVWIGVGPSQSGPASLAKVPSPVALTFGFTVREQLVLSLRAGLGFDWIDGGSRGGATFTPTATYLPTVLRGVFLAGGPMLHIGGGNGAWLLGGAELGVGKLFFIGENASIDLGLHAQGLVGGGDEYEYGPQKPKHLRGLLRLGLSLWTRGVAR